MLWWGYKHIHGSYQAKPYFDRIDLDDAYASPFVDRVAEPFEATSREDAIAKIIIGCLCTDNCRHK